MTHEISLFINGVVKNIKFSEDSVLLRTALIKLGYKPELVVVEVNGVIIPCTSWNNTKVKSGDTLEIVTIVGGGS